MITPQEVEFYNKVPHDIMAVFDQKISDGWCQIRKMSKVYLASTPLPDWQGGDLISDVVRAYQSVGWEVQVFDDFLIFRC